MAESQATNWEIVPFDRKTHDRSLFDCGNALLNQWLIRSAGQFERRDLARVYVLIAEGSSRVCGYYSLSMHSVAYESLPQDQAKGIPVVKIPVALLGKLAIDRTTQGQHLGEFLLLDAMKRTELLAERIGLRGLEVDAIDESARRFYLRYGFLELLDDPQHLFLPVQVIRALKLNDD